MADDAMPTDDELAALVGHRFPGGRYTIAHWENWLLTDCTGREPLPDGLVHPVALFHVPILGARTSIAELFALGRASGAGGSVGLLGYDWEYLAPLHEEVPYQVEGGIVEAERVRGDAGSVVDRVAFRIELSDGDGVAARITNRWAFRRTPAAPGTKPPVDGGNGGDAGDPIAPWRMASVDAARMKTMAAILRDPYPVHWDRSANERLGLGGRVINQGPLNLSYIANMLMAWAGPRAVRRLTVRFGRPVLDGDDVEANGRVLEAVDGVARCSVWLARGDERVVTGEAQVAVPE